MGECHAGLGAHDQAIACYRRAIALKPEEPLYHYNLGNLLQAVQRQEAAITCYKAALKWRPGFSEAHFNLGRLLLKLGHRSEALEVLQQGLHLNPAEAQLYALMGTALQAEGRINEAEDHFIHALELQPDLATIHGELGRLRHADGRLEEAAASYREALRLAPERADLHNDLGDLYKGGDRYMEALYCFDQALALEPDDVQALNNRGAVLTDLGRMDEALDCYDRALSLAPHTITARNRINLLLYRPETDHDALWQACLMLLQVALLETPVIPLECQGLPWSHGGEDRRRLRVGYLSSDLRNHPLAYNLLPLLKHHDRLRFELYAYADLPHEDAMSRQLRTYFDHWIPVTGWSDHQIAARIAEDGIQVMLYLASFFDGNRPLVAAYRPAPVQISLFNSTSTALPEMDYWLTDGLLHPEDGVQECFSEKLCYYAYETPQEAPDPGELPQDRNGYITFISLNNPTKIHDRVLAIWGRILEGAPGSRLRLKYRRRFLNKVIQNRILTALAKQGIGSERIDFLGAQEERGQHLAHYQAADIALDPFPFTGATTTFQALWMGVPVITLQGTRFLARMGADIVSQAGLETLLVASSEEAYVTKTLALVENPGKLRELRRTLRGQVANSPLCDGPGYASSLEQAYSAMWVDHINASASSSGRHRPD